MSEISKSIQIICDEKGLNYETVLEAVESALAAAYRKDFGNRGQNIKVKFDEETADLAQFNPKTQIMLKEAKEHDKKAEIGTTLKINLEVPGEFGRMAAQTAKQVIMQKLREAERNTVFEDFKHQEGQIVQGTVQRRDRNGSFIIELGKITGILPSEEQIQKEFYRPGARLKFYVKSVEM